jgi:hypothetical protein
VRRFSRECLSAAMLAWIVLTPPYTTEPPTRDSSFRSSGCRRR